MTVEGAPEETFKAFWHDAKARWGDRVSVAGSNSFEIDCTEPGAFTYGVRQLLEEKGYTVDYKRDGRFKRGVNPDVLIVRVPGDADPLGRPEGER